MNHSRIMRSRKIMLLAIYAEQQWKQNSTLASVKHAVRKTPVIYHSSELVIQDLFLGNLNLSHFPMRTLFIPYHTKIKSDNMNAVMMKHRMELWQHKGPQAQSSKMDILCYVTNQSSQEKWILCSALYAIWGIFNINRVLEVHSWFFCSDFMFS